MISPVRLTAPEGPLSEDYYKRVGRRLRQARESLGMTQEEVALHLGVSVQAYNRYELGERKITIPDVKVAARYLSVPWERILAEDDAPARRVRAPEEIVAELAASIRSQEMPPPTGDVLRDALLEQLRRDPEAEVLLDALGRAPTLEELLSVMKFGLRTQSAVPDAFRR
jgi:transcriptional regulator with XRE-family HTH domain